MRDLPTTIPERMLELLADRATQGLGEDEVRELDALSLRAPRVAGDGLDLAAAAAAVAMVGQEEMEAIPESLRARLMTTAAAFGALRGPGAGAPMHDGVLRPGPGTAS